MLNSVVQISVMFAKYFEYYIIILGGGLFFVDTLYTGAKHIRMTVQVLWQHSSLCHWPW